MSSEERVARPSTVALPDGRAERYRIARIVVVAPDGPERSIVLGRRQVRIGADPTNDVVVSDPHVSRFHCELRRTDAGFVLRDLDSTNGTRVGGISVHEGLLDPGASVTIGQTRIRFLSDEGRPEEVVVSPNTAFGDVDGRSVAMRELFGLLERISPTELTVLLQGETGAGKDRLARAIHAASARRGRPFEVFDCGAVAPTLIESALFGHVKGAFTGAVDSRDGAFARARGGTLLLDEIGELALDLQPKLLRALEQRQVRPVGGDREEAVDVRVIAATHRQLDQLVKQGRFRQDLYYRLSVVTLDVPPLRERLEDLPQLAERILSTLPVPARLSAESIETLRRYDWPGNVRELRNVIEAARAVCDGDLIEPRHLALFRPQRRDVDPSQIALAGRTLESIERAAIEQTLLRCGGNKTRSARELGISASTLYEKIKKYGIGGG